MKHTKTNKKSGFTLIELLVVISIISLLSSVVMASVVGAREKARASAFSQNMKQFQLALENYKSDTGVYPGENDGESGAVQALPSIDNLSRYLSGEDVGGGLSQLTAPIIPNYLSKIDLPPEESLAIIYYNSPYPTRLDGYSCGGSKIEGGYLIVINGPLTELLSNLTIPVFNSPDGTPYISGGTHYWCFTAAQ